MSAEPINEINENNEINVWETLKDHEDYEINVNYPYQIRKKSTGRIISEYEDKDGYLHCSLNRKNFIKHRLIAFQWIPNPDNLPCIDHINHIRTDNRIENLRFVSVQMNNKNKSVHNGKHYTFLDELPETAESLDSYNGFDLGGVYIDYENEKLYLFNGVRYRELLPIRNRGSIRYFVYDIENNRIYMNHKVLFG